MLHEHDDRRRLLYCPHCRQPLQPLRYGLAWGPLATRIIDAIESSGNRGIGVNDLVAAVYSTRSDANIARLRSYISAINRALVRKGAGISIRGDRRAYRLVQMRQCA